MDPLTASIALSITQLCISAIMAGIYFAAPSERHTQLWALSGILSGIGVTMVLLNTGRPISLLLVLGNISLFAGCVAVWMGLRIFFGQSATRWGYLLVALYALLFLLFLANDAGFVVRAYLASSGLLLIFVLCLRTLLRRADDRAGERNTLARGLAIVGLVLLIGMHVLRIAVLSYDPTLFSPATMSHFGAIVLYLVPLAGTQLFFSALLLLYFYRLKDNLRLSLSAKQEALDAQMRFVDMFSHEYRTPLAVIRTNLDILQSKDQFNGGNFAPNLAKMQRAVLRLAEMAETALTTERIADGAIEVRPELIAAPDFLRAILEEAQVFWSHHSPRLRLDHVDPVVFSGDRKLLKTALLNLLDNAIKYGPPGNAVAVRLEVMDNTIRLTVSDDGPGIPEAELSQVCQQYFRGSRTGAIGGSGMGLYLVKNIAGLHAGSINLSNLPGGGTMATMTLPLHTREYRGEKVRH